MNEGSLLVGEDGRLRPIWRSLAGLAVFYVALNLAPFAIIPFENRSFVAREFVSRCVLTLLITAGFSLLLIALDQIEGSPLAAMGLPFRRASVRYGVLGFCFGAAMIVLAVVAIAVCGHLSYTVTIALPTMIRPMLLVTGMLAMGAMFEELAFRGYPFQRLVEAIGSVAAVVVTSVIFAATHIANPHASVFSIVNTAAVGVLFALAYLKTRSLWLPWGMHFGWNFTLGVLFGLPVSGITGFSVISHGVATGPAWLTGGAYGIEASATGTVVIVLGAIVLGLLCRGPVGVPSCAPVDAESR